MTPIPQEILDKGWTKKVHVEGWNRACCFFYVGTDQWGQHTVRTQVKPVKTYQTRNNLCYTKKYDPNWPPKEEAG